MRKLMCLLFMSGAIHVAFGQVAKKSLKDTIPLGIDSSLTEELKSNLAENIPVISLDEDDISDGSTQNISSTLGAGRDPFFSVVNFNFNAVRFRVRGYDGDNFGTYINGIPMENLDNGFTPFGLWGGLNDVMRRRNLSIGLRHNTFSFGDIGSNISIDTRASKQRKQTQLGYAFSNRTYTHRWAASYSTGLNSKGWAFTVSGSRRWADEGYTPGTYYNGWSYFLGIDKQISPNSLLSLVIFNAPTESGKQGAVVDEVRKITGDNYYNPNWGYQNGKKRNANLAKTNQPYIILTHDHRINSVSTLVSAVGLSFGERGATGLDWFNSADPRPDYYRYLPSYALDPSIAATVSETFKNDPSVSQINWAALYNANRNNVETNFGFTGRRSSYVQTERVTNTKRVTFNVTYNTQFHKWIDYTAGFNVQTQLNNYYQKVIDLLGGDYIMNWNQFAERDFGSDDIVRQYDLDNPNRIVKKGDRYGYDYNINIIKSSVWNQAVFNFRKLEVFVAGEASHTEFKRIGNVRNGLFPTNSYGPSATNQFNNLSLKGGLTYKFNNRHYVYGNAAYITRPPMFDNVFLSARTRNSQQASVTSETIKTVDAGYMLNTPILKMRVSGYYTEFKDQMDVKSFYDDQYRNFVNYALRNISKLHFGGELGFDAKVTREISIDGAAAIGRYYYNSRQFAVTTLDNTQDLLGRDTIYNQNYRVAGTPQEAYSLGITYRSRNYWSVGLTGNYFDQMWVDINPIRRTRGAVDGLDYKGTNWSQILDQEQLAAQYSIDFFAHYSWKVPRTLGLKKNTFVGFNLGVNNILNNQNIRTGGFEQLRFDFAGRNANKFPSKYIYSYGTTYYLGISIRF